MNDCVRQQVRTSHVTIVIKRTHLSIDKMSAEHIRQDQNRLVLRIVSSGRGNIRIDPANLLPFAFFIVKFWAGRSCLEITYL
jgi:hypothetical protein